ncbi:hypothetical protein J437_LFUL013744 [Ladona fulva]|uniref:Calcium release-activated calcium channel protein 1 n=1 Tax=Ladona fulva TaxID=123851 RepID=A0A8K0KF65_LADFU|nr:hypothetical protein J437_LFUL013744 [Ladona fulva]
MLSATKVFVYGSVGHGGRRRLLERLQAGRISGQRGSEEREEFGRDRNPSKYEPSLFSFDGHHGMFLRFLDFLFFRLPHPVPAAAATASPKGEAPLQEYLELPPQRREGSSPFQWLSGVLPIGQTSEADADTAPLLSVGGLQDGTPPVWGDFGPKRLRASVRAGALAAEPDDGSAAPPAPKLHCFPFLERPVAIREPSEELVAGDHRWLSVLSLLLPMRSEALPETAAKYEFGVKGNLNIQREEANRLVMEYQHSQVSHLYGSYEGLMGSVAHPVEPVSHHGHGSAPLTAEGLSWRRLHMSRAKLKATATTSELLSGFAMVAMVELQINEPTNVPEWLFVLFAVCTTVLVSVHIFALMISTYILPNVDAVSKMQHSAGGNEGNTHLSHRRNASHSSSISFTSGVDPAVLESPHERMRGFIEIAWAFSTVLGLFLFLVELGILCWVKFWDHSFIAAWAATAIVIPVLVLFVVFATHFYRSLVAIKCDTSASDMRDLEKMKADLDAASRDAAAASNV